MSNRVYLTYSIARSPQVILMITVVVVFVQTPGYGVRSVVLVRKIEKYKLFDVSASVVRIGYSECLYFTFVPKRTHSCYHRVILAVPLSTL
jgi:hypothetical protein